MQVVNSLVSGIVVALVVRRKQASKFVLILGYTIKQLNTLILIRLSSKVLRPKLSKQCLYDLSGAIMEIALFCTRSLRQSGRPWWKMGEQYSSTDFILYSESQQYLYSSRWTKKIHRGYYMAARRYLCWKIFHEWAQRTGEIFFSTREEKFRISKRPCNVLFII